MTEMEDFMAKLEVLVRRAVAQGMDPGDVADALKLMSESVDEVLSDEDEA